MKVKGWLSVRLARWVKDHRFFSASKRHPDNLIIDQLMIPKDPLSDSFRKAWIVPFRLRCLRVVHRWPPVVHRFGLWSFGFEADRDTRPTRHKTYITLQVSELTQLMPLESAQKPQEVEAEVKATAWTPQIAGRELTWMGAKGCVVLLRSLVELANLHQPTSGTNCVADGFRGRTLFE